MKYNYLSAISILMCLSSWAQTNVFNGGTNIHVDPNATFYISGDYTFAPTSEPTRAKTRINGELLIAGDITNASQSLLFLDEGIPGQIRFFGDQNQSISGATSSIYLPSIFLEKTSNSDLHLNHDILVDSTIYFTSGDIQANNSGITMQTAGIIVNENESSRLNLGSGMLSVEVPTLSGLFDAFPEIEPPYFPPAELSLDNIYGLGFGLSSAGQAAQGEDGVSQVQISRFDQFNSTTQIANGNVAARFYRMEYHEPNIEDLENLIFHYFNSDFSGLPPTNELALYVSSDDGNSWIKIAGGQFASGILSSTLTVSNVPTQGSINDPHVNWFAIAESDCYLENMPNNTFAIASTHQIDNDASVYVINACAGENLTVSYNNANAYSWWFEGQMIAENTMLNLINLNNANDEGIYSIQLRNTKGCETSRGVQINVWNPPSVDFSFVAQDQCLGESVDFTHETPTDQGEIVSHLWSFGDGNSSILRNPSHTFFQSGIYNVTLEVESEYECVSSTQKDVYVHPFSVSEFEININKGGSEIYQICSGTEVFLDPHHSIFYETVFGDEVFPTLQWDFGDGQQEQITAAGFPEIETYGEVYHTYDVTSDQIFDVELSAETNNGCITLSQQSISVFAEPNPSFSIEINTQNVTEGCVGEELHFTSNAALTDESAFDYLWTFGDGSISIDPRPDKAFDENGIFQVDLLVTSKASGCGTASQVVFQVNSSSEIPYGNEVTSCGNSYEFDAGNPGSDYRWSNANTDATLSTERIYAISSASAEPILIRLEITNTSGCITEQLIEVSLNTDLFIDLGENRSACQQAILGTDEFPNASFLWSTGETTPFIEVFTSGTYSVQITEPEFGCVTSDEVEIEILLLPEINLGSDLEICDGTVITLNAGGHTSYLWSNGSSESFLDVTVSGTYWVDVSDDFGCTARDYVSVSFQDFITDPAGEVIECSPACQDGPSASFRIEEGLNSNDACTSSQLLFVSEDAKSDPSAFDYQWDFGDGTSSELSSPYKTYSEPGNYQVQLFITSKVSECSAISQDNVAIVTSPEILYGNVISTCGSSLELDALNPGSVYSWSNAVSGEFLSSNQNYTVSSNDAEPISILLEITNVSGCQVSQEIQVLLNTEPVIDLGSDRSVCQQVTLGTDEFPTASFLWSTGEITPFIEVFTSGIYSIQITEPEFSCVTSDEVEIEILQLPEINLGSDLEICDGTPLTLDAGEHSNYLWSDGSTSSHLDIGSKGVYWVEVTDMSGCLNRDSIFVEFRNDPTLTLPSEIELCGSGGYALDAGISDVNYSWESKKGFTSLERSILIEEPDTYWVTIENEAGCIQSDTVQAFETSNQLAALFLIPSVVGVGDLVNIVQLTDPLPESSRWSFGDGVFSKKVNPSHRYLKKGGFIITLAISDVICSDTLRKEISVVDPRIVVAEESRKPEVLEVFKLEAYPNPVFEKFNLQIELSAKTTIHTQIFNLAGRRIYQSQKELKEDEFSVDLSEELPGMYLINVQIGKENRMLKIYKQ